MIDSQNDHPGRNALIIREAKPEDAAAMARVRVDTWRAAYRGIVPDSTLDNLSYSTTEGFLRRILWEDNRGTFAFVAENDRAEVVGIAVAGAMLDRGDDDYRGEIYILYVLPAWQGIGGGRGLVQACMHGLNQRRLIPVMLWVLADNPARKFYEALGGVMLREREDVMDGKKLIEVAYGWSKD